MKLFFGLIVLMAFAAIGMFLTNMPLQNGMCFNPPAASSGTSYGTAGIVDPDSGLPDDVQCDIFLEVAGKVYFNAAKIGTGCRYAEIISIDPMHGGTLINVSSGNPDDPIAVQCFKWAEEHLPESPFTEHWGLMREY